MLIIAFALMVPTVAHAEWNLYHSGDIAPGGYRGTAQAQQRYTKRIDWVVETRCTENWYRNQDSVVDYYVVQDCQSKLEDTRNSTQAAWTYCKNISSFTINAQCYTCINTSGLCP
jgi:hypothetical protein